MFKSWLKRVLPPAVVRRLQAPPVHYWRSYAQEGEDMILRRYFDQMTAPGFFVDVGAHHPETFSNTSYFYRIGWRGINIDATPAGMEPFARLRPRDINIEAAISDETKMLTYCIFNQPALNSFDIALSESRDGRQGARIVRRLQMQTQRLSSLLAEHLPPGQSIDFLSVDVEGFDLNVLRSNDWSLYRPRIALVEDMSVSSLKEIHGSAITAYMHENNYVPFACTVHTVFYKRDEED